MVKDFKAGRNDPCPCGSGLKFKKCCLNKTWSSKKAMTDLPPDDLKLMQELFRKHHDRLNKFGQVRPIAHANVKDQKVTSVGNQIYYSENKSNSLTFIDFLGDYLKIKIGRDWGTSEIKKPLETRHPILKLYDSLCKYEQKFEKDQNGLYSADPSGPMKAYYLLAYDLYTLDHHAALQEKIIKRLKNYKGFQGARYELLVAATCVRAGFNIDYTDESDRSSKHPEFIAIDKETGLNRP